MLTIESRLRSISGSPDEDTFRVGGTNVGIGSSVVGVKVDGITELIISLVPLIYTVVPESLSGCGTNVGTRRSMVGVDVDGITGVVNSLLPFIDTVVPESFLCARQCTIPTKRRLARRKRSMA